MAARKAATHAQPARLNAGFTLVEIAVVMVLISLMIGALLPLINAQTANTRVNATRVREDAIRTALITYVGQHGYLPCPADGWVAAGDPLYGHEARTSPVTTLPAGNCDLLISKDHTPPSYLAMATGNAAIPSITVYRGVLPWLDLGLPEDSANDAWNQRISYFVTDLGVTGYASREAISGMLGGLTICSAISTASAVLLTPQNGGSNTLCVTPAANALVSVQSPAVALVSHGENGFGAFLPGGLIKPYATQASPNELANIDLKQYALVQSGYARDFDDLMLWLSPADLTAPLIKAGALPSMQALSRSRLDEARTLIVASMVNARHAELDPTGCAWGWSYPLEQPLANVVAGCTPFCGSNGTSPALYAPALPADLVNSTTPLTPALLATWVFTFDGSNPINGPGSNRNATNAALGSFDPWGSPLLFSTLGNSMPARATPPFARGPNFTISQPDASAPPYAFLIYSVGPDGLAGTADDASLGVSVNELKSALSSLGAFAASTSGASTCTAPPTKG